MICIVTDSKVQPPNYSSLPRNYELVGDFATPGISYIKFTKNVISSLVANMEVDNNVMCFVDNVLG